MPDKNNNFIKSENHGYFDTDPAGNLIIPAETASRLGIKIGDRVRYKEEGSTLTMRLPMLLSKLYIEVTNQCNLNCRTCIRNVWYERPGMMSEWIFDSIVSGLSSFSGLPGKVFFGGFGEPLYHPRIISMISHIKKMGISTELITNGTLLKKEMIVSLIESGLDTIWISLDGSTPESFSDIRIGAERPNILDNLNILNSINYSGNSIRGF